LQLEFAVSAFCCHRCISYSLIVGTRRVYVLFLCRHANSVQEVTYILCDSVREGDSWCGKSPAHFNIFPNENTEIMEPLRR